MPKVVRHRQIFATSPNLAAAGRLSVFLVLLLALGCQQEPALRLAVPDRPVPLEVANALQAFLQNSGVAVEIKLLAPGDAPIEALRSGEAELTLLSNGTSADPQVRAILPLFSGALHWVARRDFQLLDPAEILRSQPVFADPSARAVIEAFAAHLGLEQTDLTWVDTPSEPGVGSIAVFSPMSPRLLAKVGVIIPDRLRFVSIEAVEQIGKGGILDSVCISLPHMRPTVIPGAFYGRANPDPVATLQTDILLVGRSDLDSDLIYEITRRLVEEKSMLIRGGNNYLHHIGEPFDPAMLTLPMHPGARRYLERDQPGLLERYSESFGVIFSIALAVISGLVAMRRWRVQRKKDRIDQYYAAALEIRSDTDSAADRDLLLGAMRRLDDLERRAFEQLIDERLAGDESFRIFIDLINRIRASIRQRTD